MKDILPEPQTIVDSAAKVAISGLGFFPKVAKNMAQVATNYAASAERDLEDFKAKMPKEPGVVPRVIGSAIGETVGAFIGGFEAVVRAGADTASDIKSQIRRVTG